MNKINVTNSVPSVYVPSIFKRILAETQSLLNLFVDGFLVQVTTVTGTTYTVLKSDSVLICDTTSASKTLTLPAANTTKEKIFFIKKTDTGGNTITVQASSGNVEGAATNVISASRGSGIYASDGTDYWKL
jgi:hypothetical protein